MNPQQFAQKIKTKYPEYSDVDDLELTNKIIEKYPVYADQVTFNAPTMATRPSGQTGLKGFSTGFTKGLLEGGRQLGKLGQEVAQQTAGRVLETATGRPKESFGSKLYEGQTPDILKPNTTAETVGFGTEKVAEFFAPIGVTNKARVALNATRAPFLLKLLGKAGVEATATGGVAALQGQTFEDIKDIGLAAGGLELATGVVGKLINTPVGKKAISYLTEKIPARQLNSIIKPDNKAFNFGKDPGLAVSQEGITSFTRGGLLTKIAQSKEKIWKQAEQLMAKQGDIALDVMPAISQPLQEAKQNAINIGEKTLWSRLDDLEQGLTNLFSKTEKGIAPSGTKLLDQLSPKQVQEMKSLLGQSTKWTGQAFDNDVNQVRVQIYRNLDGILDNAVPGIDKLNNRYANLLTAEKNLERTNKNIQRMVSLGLRQTGVGTAVGLGSLATGDSGLESALKAGGGVALFSALGSTGFKTNFANQLTKLKPSEQEKIFRLLPALRNVYFGVTKPTQE